jgi:hypothetical protein
VYAEAKPIHIIVPGSTRPAVMQLSCAGPNGSSTLTRGTKVTCTASVEPRQAFRIAERKAEGTRYTYSTTDPIASDGEPVQWEGTAVIDTKVTMTAVVMAKGSESRLAPASANITVVARAGPEWDSLAVQVLPVGQEKFVPGRPLLEYPFTVAPGGTMDSPDGALGQYVSTMTVRWRVVSGGPNTGIVYAGFPFDLAPPVIYIHSVLQPGSEFRRKQIGNPNIVFGLKPCSDTDIGALRNRVLDHERQHYDVDRRYFAEHKVQPAIEAAYATLDIGQAMDPKIQEAAQNEALNIAYLKDWSALQHVVDTDHTVRLPACRIQ